MPESIAETVKDSEGNLWFHRKLQVMINKSIAFGFGETEIRKIFVLTRGVWFKLHQTKFDITSEFPLGPSSCPLVTFVVFSLFLSNSLILSFKGDSLTDHGNANPLCGGLYSMATLAKASFYCKPRQTGRYLNIRLVGNSMILTLCEVEVYSESRGVIHLDLRFVFISFHFRLTI